MSMCKVHAEQYERVLVASIAFLAAVEAEERRRFEYEEERRLKREEARKRRPWVRDWIARRSQLGGERLLGELYSEDPASFANALRMNKDRFDELLNMIKLKIQKQDTRMREALPASLKLQVTLRYLASGDSFKSLSLLFRLPPSSISTFLPEVLKAIVKALSGFLKFPQTAQDWEKIATLFARKWNFPRCCGAMDGKHIQIKAPPRSGSTFINYKGFFSTVLFAVVDGDYNFTYVHIGTNGRENDAGIFSDSSLGRGLQENTLNFPKDHVLIGDSIFPLKEYLMIPYTRRICSTMQRRIFNYRLSRARRIVENAFGILSWRFRVFMRPIELKVDTVDYVVLAACSLHNWLRSFSPNYMTSTCVDQEDLNTGEVIPGEWRRAGNGLPSMGSVRRSNNYAGAAETVRRTYATYFCNEGAIHSQWVATGYAPNDYDHVLVEEEEEEEEEIANNDHDLNTDPAHMSD